MAMQISERDLHMCPVGPLREWECKILKRLEMFIIGHCEQRFYL
jgi:hypothetical protein